MKKLILLVLLCTLFGQDKNVTFISGYGGSPGTWQTTEGILGSSFQIQTAIPEYNNTGTSIPTAAAGLQPDVLSSSLAISHSMGGLISREMIMQGFDNKVQEIITVGTPHSGLYFGLNAPQYTGDVLFRAAYFLGAPFWSDLGGAFVYGAVCGDLVNFVLLHYIGGDPALAEMYPGSDYMNSINANPGTSFADVNFSISSEAFYPTPVYLVAGYAQADPEEFLNAFFSVASYYYTMYNICAVYASYLIDMYYDPSSEFFHDPFILTEAYLWDYYGYLWYHGVVWFDTFVQLDWDVLMTGVATAWVSNGNLYVSYTDLDDGVVPYSRQFFPGISTNHQHEIEGISHTEEGHNSVVRDDIYDIMLNNLGIPLLE